MKTQEQLQQEKEEIAYQLRRFADKIEDAPARVHAMILGIYWDTGEFTRAQHISEGGNLFAVAGGLECMKTDIINRVMNTSVERKL